MDVKGKERHEIVKQLTQASIEALTKADDECMPDGEFVDMLAGILDVDTGNGGNEFDSNFLYRLARLIGGQATSRNGKFKTKYGRKVPVCEWCVGITARAAAR